MYLLPEIWQNIIWQTFEEVDGDPERRLWDSSTTILLSHTCHFLYDLHCLTRFAGLTLHDLQFQNSEVLYRSLNGIREFNRPEWSFFSARQLELLADHALLSHAFTISHPVTVETNGQSDKFTSLCTVPGRLEKEISEDPNLYIRCTRMSRTLRWSYQHGAELFYAVALGKEEVKDQKERELLSWKPTLRNIKLLWQQYDAHCPFSEGDGAEDCPWIQRTVLPVQAISIDTSVPSVKATFY